MKLENNEDQHRERINVAQQKVDLMKQKNNQRNK